MNTHRHAHVYMPEKASVISMQLNDQVSSPVAQTVKNLPAMQETWVQSLGQEDLLQEEMATHSSVLAWKILWTEEPGRLQSIGLQPVGHSWVTNTKYLHTVTFLGSNTVPSEWTVWLFNVFPASKSQCLYCSVWARPACLCLTSWWADRILSACWW